MSRLKRILKNPRNYFTIHHITYNVIGIWFLKYWILLSKWIKSDRLFLAVYYRIIMQESLNLDQPLNFTQKLQWLKLYHKGLVLSRMVDKYEVRKIITEKIGDEFLIPLIGVWDNFNKIDVDNLPEQFVLKTTHDSGNTLLCFNKKDFNFASANERLSKALKINYFYKSREYPYKNAIPRIIAERYMTDGDQKELDDYKFFCFHGDPKFVQITSGKGWNKKIGFYDMDLQPMPFTIGNKKNPKLETPPQNFVKMIEIAKRLSENLIHVRIDLYNLDGRIYFGEFTFHHAGGMVHFNPPEWNTKVGEMIKLPI